MKKNNLKIAVFTVLAAALMVQPVEAMNRKPHWPRIIMVSASILGAGYLAYNYFSGSSIEQVVENNVNEENNLEEDGAKLLLNEEELQVLTQKEKEQKLKEEKERKLKEEELAKELQQFKEKERLEKNNSITQEDKNSLKIIDTSKLTCDQESDDFFETDKKVIFKVWSKVQDSSLNEKELKNKFKSVFSDCNRHKQFSRFGLINKKLVALMIVEDAFGWKLNTFYTAKIIATSRAYAKELFKSFLKEIELPKYASQISGENKCNDEVETNKKVEDYAVFKFGFKNYYKIR